MKKINIYLDATGFKNFQTGVGRYSFQLITGLLGIAREWQFHVLVQKQLSESHPVYMLAQHHRNCIIKKIGASAVGPKRDMYFLFSPIRERNLYHCLNSNLPFAIRHNSVVTVHDIIYRHYYQFLGAGYPLKLLYYNVIMQHVARNATQIIAVSHATAQDFIRHYAKRQEARVLLQKKTTVIHEAPFPVPVMHNSNNTKGEKSHFLYVGELRPHKNIDCLLVAFAQFRRSTPGSERVMLSIVGSPHSSYSLPNPLPDNVEYRGRAGDQELTRLYQSAIALCFVSLYEGFGLPILESMRHRVPVITSNTSSMPEIAGDAALLVDPKNSNEIGQAMQRVFTSSQLRAELVARGLERVQQFSWHDTAIQTLKVYETILKEEKSVH